MSKKMVLVLLLLVSLAAISFSGQLVGACGPAGVTFSHNPC
jgi:hypothetical protein